MSFTAHFAFLGAKLRNSRQSWGAIRRDGLIILRVWADQTCVRDDGHFVRLTFNARFVDDPNNAGYRERAEHVELIRQGRPYAMVFCFAKDTSAHTREVKTFNDERIYPGGKLIELDGDWWAERLKPIPVSQFVAAADQH